MSRKNTYSDDGTVYTEWLDKNDNFKRKHKMPTTVCLGRNKYQWCSGMHYYFEIVLYKEGWLIPHSYIETEDDVTIYLDGRIQK